MKKKNLIFSGLLLLAIVIAGFMIFGLQGNTQIQQVNSAESKLKQDSSVPVLNTKSAVADSKIAKRIAQAISSDLNSKIKNPYALRDETFAEMVANRGGRFIGICDGLDIKSGNSEITRSLLFESKVTKQEWDKILGTEYFFSVRHFQNSLPFNYKNLSQDEGAIEKGLQEKSQLELIQNLERAKVVALRAYYAVILGRVLFENKKMFGDNEFTDICEKLNNMNINLSRDELNEIVSGYLDRAQVKAPEVKFNPHFVPHVIIFDSGGNHMYFEDTESGSF